MKRIKPRKNTLSGTIYLRHSGNHYVALSPVMVSGHWNFIRFSPLIFHLMPIINYTWLRSLKILVNVYKCSNKAFSATTSLFSKIHIAQSTW